MILASAVFGLFIVINLKATQQELPTNSLAMYFVCVFCTQLIAPANQSVVPTSSTDSVVRADSHRNAAPFDQLKSTRDSSSKFSETCTNVKAGNTKQGEWYNFSADNFQIYAFSAVLYDPGLSTVSNPAIRLTTVTSMYGTLDPAMPREKKTSLKFSIPDLVCIIHYSDGTKVAVMKTAPLEIGFGGLLHGENAFQYIYECALESSSITLPVAVSISTLDDVFYNRRQTECMPIEIPKRPPKKKDFVVCGPVSYGNVDPYRIVEWMEMLKLLGVDRVVIYDIGVYPSARRVLEHYAREGFLDLRITIPFGSNEQLHHKLHSTPTINDCMYRNMHAFNYVIVLDFDEIIVPIGPEIMPLRALIDDINVLFGNSHLLRPASYAFRNSYFFLDIPPDANESKYSVYLGYRKRAPISEKGLYGKSIHNPLACSHAHNHYCWGKTQPFNNNILSLDVDYNKAVNCHYKTCNLKNLTCEEHIKNSINFDVMMKYKPALLPNILRVLQSYFNHSA